MARLVFSAVIPSTGGVNINLEHASGPLVAPAQVNVEATGHAGLADFERSGTFYDGAWHEYYHEWTVRGEPLPDFDATNNMPGVWLNANKYGGKRACIALSEPGDYIIDLTVTDKNGVKAVAFTSTITVAAATSVYSEADTVYVDQTGAFTGVPAASGKVASMTALWAYLNSNKRPHLVLLRRGDDYQDDEYLRTQNDFLQIAHTDAWGTGTKPILRISTGTTGTYLERAGYELYTVPSMDQVSLANVSIVGDWDSTTETGANSKSSGIYLRPDSSVEIFFTAYNVDISGVGIGINMSPSGVGGNMHVCFANSSVTNWRDYGTFAQNMTTGSLALLGASMAQHVDALHGGTFRDVSGTSDQFSNNHGPVRMDQIGFFYSNATRLFSRSGWSGLGADHRADQPCIRFNTNGVPGVSIYVGKSILEGGSQIVNIEGENTNTDDVAGRAVFEDFLMIATAKQTGQMVSSQQGAATFRNGLIFYPDIVQIGSASTRAVFEFKPNKPVSGSEDEPVTVHNISVFNALDAANDFGASMILTDIATVTDFIGENNIYHFPNGTNSNVEAHVVVEPLEGVTPLYKGVRYGFAPVEVILAATVQDGETITIPYTAIDKRLTSGAYESAGATDQAYWLANAGTRHRIGIKGTSTPHLNAHTGGITVDFNATEVVITLTAGGSFGAAGKVVQVQLDRSGVIPQMDTAYASPATVQVVRHNSAGPSASGRVTRKDALGVKRSEVPARGALNQI